MNRWSWRYAGAAWLALVPAAIGEEPTKANRFDDRDAAPEIARGLALTIEGFTLEALARPMAVPIAGNGLGTPGSVFGNASRTGGQGAGAAATGSITGGSADLTGGATVGAGNANRTGGQGAGSGAGNLTGSAAGAAPIVSSAPNQLDSSGRPGNMRVTSVSLMPGKSSEMLRRQARQSLDDGERLLKQFSPADGPSKKLHEASTRYADRVRSIARLIGQRGGQGDFDVSTMALMNHAVYQGIHSGWVRRTARLSGTPDSAASKALLPLADSLESEARRSLTAIAEGFSGDSNKEIAHNALEIIQALREIEDQAAKSAGTEAPKTP